jgi:hypothetical protein
MYLSRGQRILQLALEKNNQKALKAKESLVDQWVANVARTMDADDCSDRVESSLEECAHRRTRKKTTLGKLYDEQQQTRKWKNRREGKVLGRMEKQISSVQKENIGEERPHITPKQRNILGKALEDQHQKKELKHQEKQIKFELEREVITLKAVSVSIHSNVESNQDLREKEDTDEVNVPVSTEAERVASLEDGQTVISAGIPLVLRGADVETSDEGDEIGEVEFNVPMTTVKEVESHQDLREKEDTDEVNVPVSTEAESVASLEDGQTVISAGIPLVLRGADVETSDEGDEIGEVEFNVPMIIENEVESTQERSEIDTDEVNVPVSTEAERGASLEDGQTVISSEKNLGPIFEVDEIEESSCQSEVFDPLQNLNSFRGLTLRNESYMDQKGLDETVTNFASPKDTNTMHTVTVIRTNNTGGKRKYDKRPYCLFCKEPQSHIVRHWETRHKQESQIQQLKQSSKQSRQKLIQQLRNMGNHMHNTGVLSRGVGEMVVTYRRQSETEAKQYVPCEGCLAYLCKTEMYRHRCPVKGKSRGRVARAAALLLPSPIGLTPTVHRLINGMKDDEITQVAQGDTIVKRFAAKLLEKHSFQRKEYIRAKLREICRFLLAMRKGGSDLSIKDCVHPSLFKQVIVAAKYVAGYDDSTGLYKKPSLALKIGHTLKKCAKLVKTEALLNNDNVTIEAADRFFQLCELEWNDAVSAAALKTLTNRQRNSISLLPLSEDVKKLHIYLHSQVLRGIELLTGEKTESFEAAWRNLAEAILTQLISFNRRRPGEVSRMTIADYKRRSSADLTSDIQQSFGVLERNLCKVFTRIELIGKRGRTVPVLLTTNMQNAVDLLITNRERCGIKADNPYVFAYSRSDNYLRGSDCLRVASMNCLAVHPERLRSTKLRKHVATLCQVLNMKRHELDLLAQFMGHNIAVHREFYRLPNDTLQMAHIAKIFLLMENGTLADQHGKSLTDINFDDCKFMNLFALKTITSNKQ